MKLTYQAAFLAVAFGGGTAAAQSTMFNLPGEAAGDGYGLPTRAAGDTDGDGIGDLIIGTKAGIGGTGYAQIVSGTSGTVLHDFATGVPGDHFGTAVAGIGDLTGDIYAEVIVGAPLAGTGGAGQAIVYNGRSGAVLYTLTGDSAGDHFGYSVAGLLDVDNDQVADFAVGAIDDDNQGGSSGSVRVFSGATGNVLYTLDGTESNQLFGYSLAGLPDLTGDGLGELGIGGPYVTNLQTVKAGMATVVNGATGATLYSWTGWNAKDAFGRAICPAGDVDGDTVEDVIVGAPQPLGGLRGYAQVFSGSTGLLMWDFAGDSPGDLFGTAVAAAGDVNGDTLDDVAIGAPGDDDQGSRSGSVRVMSGQAGLELFTTYGSAANHELGSSLDGGLDLNADGVPDLVAGSPGDPGQKGQGTGSAQVLSTSNLGLCASDHLLSIASGAPLSMHLDVGPAHAGRNYLVYGSITGTMPGTPFGSLTLGVNSDRYYKKTQKLNPNGNVSPPTGTLDPQGRATTSFIPPRKSPQTWLVGRTFHHVVVVVDASGTPLLSSNPWPVTMTP
jgi:hypothetical protein